MRVLRRFWSVGVAALLFIGVPMMGILAAPDTLEKTITPTDATVPIVDTALEQMTFENLDTGSEDWAFTSSGLTYSIFPIDPYSWNATVRNHSVPKTSATHQQMASFDETMPPTDAIPINDRRRDRDDEVDSINHVAMSGSDVDIGVLPETTYRTSTATINDPVPQLDRRSKAYFDFG